MCPDQATHGLHRGDRQGTRSAQPALNLTIDGSLCRIDGDESSKR